MDPTPPEPPMLIMAQYVKDFSFENPNAPEIYPAMSAKAPEITVNIDVIPFQRDERVYEVVLTLRINAVTGDKVAFLIELDHAAIVSIRESVDEEEKERLLLGETPRYLFPFARKILSDITQDAAFPPLVINPIDFDEYFRRQKKGTLKATLAAQSGAAQSGAAQSEKAQPSSPEPGSEAEPAAPDAG
ncbi:MAG: protein-export chaperone SecB [Proteobacteria bacterium]|nr:protein-export chaperone SecB [Pseudomonadota bacterium]